MFLARVECEDLARPLMSDKEFGGGLRGSHATAQADQLLLEGSLHNQGEDVRRMRVGGRYAASGAESQPDREVGVFTPRESKPVGASAPEFGLQLIDCQLIDGLQQEIRVGGEPRQCSARGVQRLLWIRPVDLLGEVTENLDLEAVGAWRRRARNSC